MDGDPIALNFNKAKSKPSTRENEESQEVRQWREGVRSTPDTVGGVNQGCSEYLMQACAV